ncbi:MAG TPA: 50S ribosomal protein L29 [Gemmatimonadales bacterium]|nr:50S ribosomal protein L29 [Gemmatimonadales bacterium]
MKDLSDADLVARIAELEREQFNLRFRAASQPLDDPLRLRAVRRDIARMKTVQRQRTMGAVPDVKPASSGRSAAKKTRARAGVKATAKKTR